MQSTDVAKEVKNCVDSSIDYNSVKFELKTDCYLNVVIMIVWSVFNWMYGKNLPRILCWVTKMKESIILKFEVSDSHLVGVLHSYSTIYGDPCKLWFFNYSFIMISLILEPLLVTIYHNELTRQPLCYFLIGFAFSFWAWLTFLPC